MQATDLACYGGVAALHGGNLGFQRIELLLNALPVSGEGLVVSICQGVVGPRTATAVTTTQTRAMHPRLTRFRFGLLLATATFARLISLIFIFLY